MRENEAAQRAGRLRVRALLFLVVALGAGAVAVVLVRQYLNSMRSAVARLEQSTQSVVVVAMEVPTATRMEAKHVSIVQWPTDAVPEGAFNKVEEVLEQTARQDMFKGEVVLRSKLVDQSQGQGLASLLAPGQRAMAVRVDPVVGVAGFVYPGDFVDVISTMQPDLETKEQRDEETAWISKVVLQHVRVLAVGDKLSSAGQKDDAVVANVFTLAVTPEQSEVLALASQYGKLQLSLRSRADIVAVETSGQSPVMLLAMGAVVASAPVATPAVPPPAAPVVRATPRPRPQVKAEDPKPAAPVAPVVEILRGTRVEERKLHSPAP